MAATATKKQRKYAQDIADLLNIPLPANENIENLGKFIAVNCEKYHAVKKEKKSKKAEQFAVQEIDVLIRLQNIKQRMSDHPLSTPQAIIEFMQSQTKNYSSEAVFVVNLDARNQVINFTKISVGTVSKSLIAGREVFKSSILSNATAILLFHNHVSGDVEPSKDDLAITNVLIQCGQLLGIPLLDHIIVNGKNYYSFLEHHELYPDIYDQRMLAD